ncbi:MAG: ATP synthase F1 subunit delta [Bdellovibrionales bacterium]|nr:ATP synthase F1 subunit delta [Bdellovibrionales bacterium]
MSQTELSRRYAKALLSVTKESNNQAIVLSELKAIQEPFNRAEIQAFFSSPVVTAEIKIESIKTAISSQKLASETSNLMLVLTKNGRLAHLGSIIESYQMLLDQESGVTRGVVRAARPLDLKVQGELESRIATTLMKKIVLTFKEDPSILGGVVADVGGWTFDDSVETHLRRMNEVLVNN